MIGDDQPRWTEKVTNQFRLSMPSGPYSCRDCQASPFPFWLGNEKRYDSTPIEDDSP